MQVILMEKVVNLGSLGDVVKVRDGYARNFLIPQGKAKRVTPGNLAEFEKRRAELEHQQVEKLSAAQEKAAKLEGMMVQITRKAGVDGRLFGSVTNFDIAEALKEQGIEVERAMRLHPDQVTVEQLAEVLGLLGLFRIGLVEIHQLLGPLDQHQVQRLEQGAARAQQAVARGQRCLALAIAERNTVQLGRRLDGPVDAFVHAHFGLQQLSDLEPAQARRRQHRGNASQIGFRTIIVSELQVVLLSLIHISEPTRPY